MQECRFASSAAVALRYMTAACGLCTLDRLCRGNEPLLFVRSRPLPSARQHSYAKPETEDAFPVETTSPFHTGNSTTLKAALSISLCESHLDNIAFQDQYTLYIAVYMARFKYF